MIYSQVKLKSIFVEQKAIQRIDLRFKNKVILYLGLKTLFSAGIVILPSAFYLPPPAFIISSQVKIK
jgi:hypothetical protein